MPYTSVLFSLSKSSQTSDPSKWQQIRHILHLSCILWKEGGRGEGRKDERGGRSREEEEGRGQAHSPWEGRQGLWEPSAPPPPPSALPPTTLVLFVSARQSKVIKRYFALFSFCIRLFAAFQAMKNSVRFFYMPSILHLYISDNYKVGPASPSPGQVTL